jgi:hypothetical protein
MWQASLRIGSYIPMGKFHVILILALVFRPVVQPVLGLGGVNPVDFVGFTLLVLFWIPVSGLYIVIYVLQLSSWYVYL